MDSTSVVRRCEAGWSGVQYLHARLAGKTLLGCIVSCPARPLNQPYPPGQVHHQLACSCHTHTHATQRGWGWPSTSHVQCMRSWAAALDHVTASYLQQWAELA